MKADHSRPTVSTPVSDFHFDRDRGELAGRYADVFTLTDPYGDGIPVDIEMAVEGVYVTRSQIEGPDEVDEGELVQRFIIRARATGAVLADPAFFTGEYFDTLIMR